MTSQAKLRFALNHMVAPTLSAMALLDLAQALSLDAIELRNDLAGVELMAGVSAGDIGREAARRGISVLTINGLQRFNQWDAAREAEAVASAAVAKAAGAKALVLVPVNDLGWQPSAIDSDRHLRVSLKALSSILGDQGLMGFVEPLGFVECSLRSKRQAAEAIKSLGLEDRFRLVHDTFHHHVAGEPELFPAMTGLVHISGVSDAAQTAATMRDPHRVLVDASDRIDNRGQMQALRDGGYAGVFSYEPFAAHVHASSTIQADLAASIAYFNAV
jgi:2-keto-myo-inositol isomerase